jgi:hypothetical protein
MVVRLLDIGGKLFRSRQATVAVAQFLVLLAGGQNGENQEDDKEKNALLQQTQPDLHTQRSDRIGSVTRELCGRYTVTMGFH